MTTRAYDYDGETVAYATESLDGRMRCGHVGRLAPWRGQRNCFGKVDWAAKWVAQDVDIEGGGKDHSTKGGSRDVANHISREIFDYEPPFDIPYEFFLIGGEENGFFKRPGRFCKRNVRSFPAEIFRLVLIGKDIREQIDVDPSGESVPRLYDWYDELAEGMREGKADDYSRLYTLCELPENRAGPLLRGRCGSAKSHSSCRCHILELRKEAERAKESALTEDEIQKLEERARYAKFWLSTYAPEEFKYELQEEMPSVKLSDVQKKALSVLADFFQSAGRSGEELHLRLHELKTEVRIQPKRSLSSNLPHLS